MIDTYSPTHLIHCKYYFFKNVFKKKKDINTTW